MFQISGFYCRHGTTTVPSQRLHVGVQNFGFRTTVESSYKQDMRTLYLEDVVPGPQQYVKSWPTPFSKQPNRLDPCKDPTQLRPSSLEPC